MAAAAFSRRARSSAVESAGTGTGRRALRAARQAQVSAPLGSVASVKVPDSFEQSFVPYRRVISCDSDFLALDATLSSVLRVLPWSRTSVCFLVVHVGCPACCSPGCGALVGGFGALCRVCAEDVRGSMAYSRGDHSDHNSWKHGPEVSGETKALYQRSGATVGRSFVDTVVGGATGGTVDLGAERRFTGWFRDLWW